MKVGIFEPYHYEGIYPVIKLFDTPNNELVIITNALTYSRLADLFREDVHRFTWVMVEKTSRTGYFKSIHATAIKHQFDLFYLNTISDNYIFYAWMIRRLPGMRIVHTIHDINCVFNSHWSWQPRELLHHIGKKALVRQVK